MVLSLFIGVITTSMQAATEEEASRVQRERLQVTLNGRSTIASTAREMTARHLLWVLHYLRGCR